MSSATSNETPLSMLAMSLMEADEVPATAELRTSVHADHHHDHAHDHAHHHEESGHGWLSFLFFFLVIALVFYFVYFALRPSFVLKHDDCSDSRSYTDDHWQEIDNGKLLGAAVVSALILLFVFWLFYAVMSYM